MIDVLNFLRINILEALNNWGRGKEATVVEALETLDYISSLPSILKKSRVGTAFCMDWVDWTISPVMKSWLLHSCCILCRFSWERLQPIWPCYLSGSWQVETFIIFSSPNWIPFMQKITVHPFEPISWHQSYVCISWHHLILIATASKLSSVHLVHQYGCFNVPRDKRGKERKGCRMTRKFCRL